MILQVLNIRSLTVDKLPIIKTFEKLDYKKLLDEYFKIHGKNPVLPDTI